MRRAGLREYILQTHNAKNEDSMVGLNLPNPLPAWYASAISQQSI